MDICKDIEQLLLQGLKNRKYLQANTSTKLLWAPRDCRSSLPHGADTALKYLCQSIDTAHDTLGAEGTGEEAHEGGEQSQCLISIE